MRSWLDAEQLREHGWIPAKSGMTWRLSVLSILIEESARKKIGRVAG